MTEFIQRQQYPTAFLPQMLQDYAAGVVASTQSTYEMVIPVMLSAMSAAVQGLVNVKTPYDTVLPTSIFSFVIAKSGERKSSVLKKVLAGFEEFERGKIPVNTMPGWSSEGYLKSHPFMIEDATSKGVTDIFKAGAYSIFYALDEAGLILKKLDMPSLCKRFDGSTINEVSRKQGPIILHDRRVAMCMLTQDATFADFKKKKGDIICTSGFMPRVLISQSYGKSNLIDIPFESKSPDNHEFNTRVKQLMRAYAKSLETDEIKRKEINFSQGARIIWERYSHDLKNRIHPYGEWADIADFLNRGGELVCRIAAVLQYFVDQEQEIQEWAIQASIQIVEWHLWEAKRIFGEGAEEISMQKDVASLYNYLLRRNQRTGQAFVLKSELLRVGPIGTRNAEMLDLAILQLQEMNRLYVFKCGPGTYVGINNNYFNLGFLRPSFCTSGF